MDLRECGCQFLIREATATNRLAISPTCKKRQVKRKDRKVGCKEENKVPELNANSPGNIVYSLVNHCGRSTPTRLPTLWIWAAARPGSMLGSQAKPPGSHRPLSGAPQCARIADPDFSIGELADTSGPNGWPTHSGCHPEPTAATCVPILSPNGMAPTRQMRAVFQTYRQMELAFIPEVPLGAR